ncbi:hypothetical protein CR194_17145 [Salipaludibacillus keqinensis]|uniref:Uncharacterized protein n=1 Tax=Salipaludibacillus keqinensis TaxID=2045207 RepID=A0A323T7P8_9BACI|nr:hypothetical protein [Salipaludibacillus keqinensis]PYZ91928.1 hypothetical protein CR194_17145 [Salipaludibacillus keqinensis]
MVINIILGAILPWIILVYLYKRDSKIVVLFVPFAIALAFIANDWGQEIFWVVTPYFENPSLSTLPINLGYFPLLACLLVYIKIKKVVNNRILLTFSISGAIALEFTALTFGKVIYLNNWNLFYTSFIYLGGALVTLSYLYLLQKFNFI